MRAGYILLGSFGLSIASTMAYLYMTRGANPNESGLAGKGADKEMQAIVDHVNEQWAKYEATFERDSEAAARDMARMLVENGDELSPEERELLEQNIRELGYDPAALMVEIKQPAPQPVTEENEPQVSSPPAAPPAPTESPARTALEAERDDAAELKQKTVLRGPDIPYKVIVPAGWKVLQNDKDRSIVSWKDELFVFFETGPWITTQEEWARKSLADMQAQFPNMQLLDQEKMEIDGRPWQEFFLREYGSMLVNPREMMVLTYGSRKRGSYRIIISGKAHALDRHVDVLNHLMRYYRFPPDNFKPDDVSSVRVYIDGERQYF